MIQREQVKEIDELKQVDDTNEWRLEGGGVAAVQWRLEGGGVAAVQLATAAAFESKRGRSDERNKVGPHIQKSQLKCG